MTLTGLLCKGCCGMQGIYTLYERKQIQGAVFLIFCKNEELFKGLNQQGGAVSRDFCQQGIHPRILGGGTTKSDCFGTHNGLQHNKSAARKKAKLAQRALIVGGRAQQLTKAADRNKDVMPALP